MGYYLEFCTTFLHFFSLQAGNAYGQHLADITNLWKYILKKNSLKKPLFMIASETRGWIILLSYPQ